MKKLIDITTNVKANHKKLRTVQKRKDVQSYSNGKKLKIIFIFMCTKERQRGREWVRQFYLAKQAANAAVASQPACNLYLMCVCVCVRAHAGIQFAGCPVYEIM